MRDVYLLPLVAKFINNYAESRALTPRAAIEEIVTKWHMEQGKYHSGLDRSSAWDRSGDDNHDV